MKPTDIYTSIQAAVQQKVSPNVTLLLRLLMGVSVLAASAERAHFSALTKSKQNTEIRR